MLVPSVRLSLRGPFQRARLVSLQPKQPGRGRCNVERLPGLPVVSGTADQFRQFIDLALGADVQPENTGPDEPALPIGDRESLALVRQAHPGNTARIHPVHGTAYRPPQAGPPQDRILFGPAGPGPIDPERGAALADEPAVERPHARRCRLRARINPQNTGPFLCLCRQVNPQIPAFLTRLEQVIKPQPPKKGPKT